jgi:hypothetical protein
VAYSSIFYSNKFGKCFFLMVRHVGDIMIPILHALILSYISINKSLEGQEGLLASIFGHAYYCHTINLWPKSSNPFNQWLPTIPLDFF